MSGYNRSGFQQPVTGSFQGSGMNGFQGPPIGGIQSYGGFQNRGAMMGGMRGGPMGMRGGRGGMNPGGMIGMPMVMGGMGMSMPQMNGGMGLQGMQGSHFHPHINQLDFTNCLPSRWDDPHLPPASRLSEFVDYGHYSQLYVGPIHTILVITG